MVRQEVKPDFNKEWAKKVGKAKFVKQLKDVYPRLNLADEYDKIVPPKKEKPKNS